MNCPLRLCSAVLAGSSLLFGAGSLPAASDMPRLEKRGPVTQLIVDGRPYLALAGEVHNSTASSLDYTRPILPKLAQMNLNTVLAVVSWDLIEPTEGRFEFALVDGLVREARANDLRLVLLWFGSWKNGLSHYVPDWVKTDVRRFPRARLSAGTTEVLSVFAEDNWKADARAFAALMKHVRSIDEAERTVIMIQVENEVGLLGDSRDRGPLANDAWGRKVPGELMDYLRSNRDRLLPETRQLWQSAGGENGGRWSEVFGTGPKAEEAFMGWHYARYVHAVVEAGKREYALPMFVNAWIVQPEDEFPGEYPTGGPQGHMLDVWRAGAPSIDILAPDIYVTEFGKVCAEFTRLGGPLFVPESRAGAQGLANAFLAIGQFGSIGYSPFGIESREPDPLKGPLHDGYAVLKQLAPLILENQAKGTISGFSLTPLNREVRLPMGGIMVSAALRTNRRNPAEVPERGFGIILQVAPEEFFVAGADAQVTFATNPPGAQIVGLATVEEGVFVDGKWTPGRTLNGDEIMIDYDMAALAARRQTGTGLRFQSSTPTIQRVKLYRYE